MKRLSRLALQGMLVLVATVLLASTWLHHPEAGPQFPQSFWMSLVDLYDARNGEELADLEALVALGLSLCTVLLVVALVKLARRYAKRRLKVPS